MGEAFGAIVTSNNCIGGGSTVATGGAAHADRLRQAATTANRLSAGGM